jgi:hypothetical protein
MIQARVKSSIPPQDFQANLQKDSYINFFWLSEHRQVIFEFEYLDNFEIICENIAECETVAKRKVSKKKKKLNQRK